MFAITISTAQVKVIDDSTAAVTKEELKYVTQKFIELELLSGLRAKDVEKMAVLERIITDKTELVALKDQTIELLKRRLEIVTPAWYDKFLYGFAVGIVVVVSVLTFIK